MIKNLKAAFNSLLAESEWMDDATRKLAKEKVKPILKKKTTMVYRR